MKLGIHAYAWCSVWSNESLHLIDRIKSLGLDFIEIPLMRLDLFDPKAVKKALSAAPIDMCTSTVLTEETDITSADPATRKNGVTYLTSCVEATRQAGGKNFSGVIYSQHVKPARSRPTPQDWRYCADALREVGLFAKDVGVTIGLEPVNRYETYLVNTCAQAQELIRLIGLDNVKIHLDTYHMNIEEKDIYAATMAAGSNLMHLHLCENDRGIPGTGLVDWDGLFKALSNIHYDGYAALESFVDCTDNMNTWVWRQLAPNGDTLVKEGISFIHKMQKKYSLIT